MRINFTNETKTASRTPESTNKDVGPIRVGMVIARNYDGVRGITVLLRILLHDV